MRRPLRALLAGLLSSLLLAATVPAIAPAAAADDTWSNRSGVAVPGNWLAWQSEAELAADLDRVVASGGTWLRTDLPWSEISWGPGHMDWTRYDRVIDGARARGLQVIAVVGTMPPHLRPAGAPVSYGPRTDGERAAFAEFTRQAAERYRGRVSHYEVWNEPNLDQGWAPTPSPWSYVRLLRAVTPAIKSACGSCVVMTGGTGGAGSGPDINPIDWYRAIYAQNPQGLFDAVAVHPFYAVSYHRWYGSLYSVAEIRGLMDANGHAGMPMWATEIGVGSGGDSGLSDAEVERFMREAVAAWREPSRGGALLWYTIQDRYPGDNMGLLRRDGSRKHTFNTLVDINRRA